MATTVNPMGPAGLWPQPGIDARQGMLNWYQQVLAEAQKIDPAASLATPGGGMGVITMKGQQIPLTNTMKDDQDRFGVTPSQMLAQKVAGGLMDLTPQQNQAVFDSQLAAINQAGGGQQVFDALQKPAVAAPDTYSGQAVPQRMMVGKTAYETGMRGEKLVQAAPQTFAPTAAAPAVETRGTYPDAGVLGKTPFAGYSVTPPTGGEYPPMDPRLFGAVPPGKLIDTPPTGGGYPTVRQTVTPPIRRLAGNATGQPKNYRMRDLLKNGRRMSGYGKF